LRGIFSCVRLSNRRVTLDGQKGEIAAQSEDWGQPCARREDEMSVVSRRVRCLNIHTEATALNDSYVRVMCLKRV
jgi:hypothetical protein